MDIEPNAADELLCAMYRAKPSIEKIRDALIGYMMLYHPTEVNDDD